MFYRSVKGSEDDEESREVERAQIEDCGFTLPFPKERVDERQREERGERQRIRRRRPEMEKPRRD
jgi:hypothetical protein